MSPKEPKKKAAPRRRRSGEEARNAILDAAEAQLQAVGPGGIRLQDVAAAVGVAHPTVLHHFGSREGLIDAVVVRALETLQAGLFEAVRKAPDTGDIAGILGSVAEGMKERGRSRGFLWLVLAGYGPGISGLRLRPLVEAVHETRRSRRTSKKRMPPLEDSYFSVLLPALALLSLSVLEKEGDKEIDPARFRAWLARLLRLHFESS